MSRESMQWTSLDNVGKLYASSSGKRDPKVFRFTCELFEEVDPGALQTALDRTVKRFPMFVTVLRRGLFWYFLEKSTIKPTVTPEQRPVCASVYDRKRRTLLFSVSYFGRRINLEVFHGLADGMGAQLFLRALIYHYLVITHADQFPAGLPVFDVDGSEAGKASDSFSKYYGGMGEGGGGGSRTTRAARLHAIRLPDHRLRFIGGKASISGLMACAKAHGATLTVFLAAVLLHAIAQELSARERRHPIVLNVPVNLRSYFESDTARNFFSVFYIRYQCGEQTPTLEEWIAFAGDWFSNELTSERLKQRLNAMTALEHNWATRALPLVLKDWILGISSLITERGVTAGLTNLGKISMPPELAGYIRHFDVYMSASRIQMCLCGYEDTLTMNITSPYAETDLQKRFFRTLSGLGVPVTVSSNHYEFLEEDADAQM